MPERLVELLKTFAEQAVIAIENVRLFEQLQAKTEDLSESLEQQTATSEVLRVIASSPTVIEPVLQAIVESAAKLCDAYDAAPVASGRRLGRLGCPLRTDTSCSKFSTRAGMGIGTVDYRPEDDTHSRCEHRWR